MDIISFSKIKKLLGIAELKENKAQPGGYASLDDNGNVPLNQLGNGGGAMISHGNEWHNPDFALQDDLTTHLTDTAADDVHGLAGKTIAESGSNANGQYVRFGDGTQICWQENITFNITGSYAQTEWTYPALFNSLPVGYLMLNGITAQGGGRRSSYLPSVASTATSTLAMSVNLIPGATATNGDWTGNKAMAIGRWK